MKKVSILFVACLLAGCAMTPTEKKIVAVGASVLIVGAIAANGGSSASTAVLNPPVGKPCTIQPDGSCR